MNYNILIAIIIIIMSICVYNYFNVSQEGNKNKDPKDYEPSSVLYREFLKEVCRDTKKINQLELNNIKYTEILGCLTYRQEGIDAKKKKRAIR